MVQRWVEGEDWCHSRDKIEQRRSLFNIWI
jgi:hypothetical protein